MESRWAGNFSFICSVVGLKKMHVFESKIWFIVWTDKGCSTSRLMHVRWMVLTIWKWNDKYCVWKVHFPPSMYVFFLCGIGKYDSLHQFVFFRPFISIIRLKKAIKNYFCPHAAFYVFFCVNNLQFKQNNFSAHLFFSRLIKSEVILILN